MDKTVVTRLKLEIADYLAPLAAAGAATKGFAKEALTTGTTANKAMSSMGPVALAAGAGIAAGLGLAVKAAIDWESEWAGVEKTVHGTAAQMGELETGLRGLATQLPASQKQIAEVAASAGQLGISRESIVSFTKTMVALSVTTNMTADEAATAIAKIANVMQTPMSDIGRFGSALVALGNVGASTESEILQMASRLAGAGKLVGASEADVLALANAMTSMGIEAQLGGGAFSRVMLKIYSAVKGGGAALHDFAGVAGQTSTQFATSFQKRPIAAIDAFIHGLSAIDQAGGNVIGTLQNLGFHGTQDLQVLLKLKGSGDLLHDSLVIGSKAWADNTALAEMAAKRYATTASQLQILKNNAVDVGIKIGGVLLPALKSATSTANTMVSGFGSLPPVVHDVAAGLGAVAAGGLGLIGMLGTFGPRVKTAVDMLSSMGSVGAAVATNLATIGTVIGVAGAALAIYSLIVGAHAKQEAEAAQRTKDFTDAIQKQGSDIGAQTSEMALQALVAGNVGKALRANGTDLDVLTKAMQASGRSGLNMRSTLQDLEVTLRRGNGKGLEGVFGNLLGQSDQMPKFISQLKSSSLAGSDLGRTLIALGESGDISSKTMAQLIARIREENASWEQGTIEARNKAAADQAVALSSQGAADGSGKLSAALQAQVQASKDAADAIKGMIDAEHAEMDPLFGMLDAIQGNNDAQAKLNQMLKEGGHSAAEISSAQLDAAKSALAMDDASTQLAGSVASGAVSFLIANAQLDEWVRNGLISAATADQMKQKFAQAGATADSIAGDRVITLKANTSDAESKLEHIAGMLGGLSKGVSFVVRMTQEIVTGAAPDPNAKVTAKGKGHARGGWAGSGQPTGPSGTDTIAAYLSPGEYVVNAQAAKAIGGPTLDRLNAMHLAGGGWADGAFGPPGSGNPAPSRPPQVITVAPAPVYFTLGADGSERHFKAWVRSWIKDEGGNVQKVLGQR